jgi:hypothetical protein
MFLRVSFPVLRWLYTYHEPSAVAKSQVALGGFHEAERRHNDTRTCSLLHPAAVIHVANLFLQDRSSPTTMRRSTPSTTWASRPSFSEVWTKLVSMVALAAISIDFYKNFVKANMLHRCLRLWFRATVCYSAARYHARHKGYVRYCAWNKQQLAG